MISPLEILMLSVTEVLRDYLPTKEMAQERARNIMQALMDEPNSEDHAAFRREVVYEALVSWRLAPAGWESRSQQAAAAVLDVLEGRR